MDKKKNNKIVIIGIIAIIFISLVITIIYIWKDNTTRATSEVSQGESQIINQKISSKDISKYTKESSEIIETEAVNKYIEEIIDLFSNKKYEEIFLKLDDKFVSENNLSEKNIQNFLNNNGYISDYVSANYKEITFYSERNDTYVYRVKFYFGRYTRYVNIIEKSPYNYTINLEQETVPQVVENSYEVKVDDIKFEIEEIEKRDDCLRYKIKVTNVSDKKVKFDFTSINNVVLVMKDGGTIKQPSSILEAGTDYSINKDSYFTKVFYFPINMQYHKDVVGFNFYNVKEGNVLKNILIRF